MGGDAGKTWRCVFAEPLVEQGRKEREDSLCGKEWRGAMRNVGPAAKDRSLRERGWGEGPDQ